MRWRTYQREAEAAGSLAAQPRERSAHELQVPAGGDHADALGGRWVVRLPLVLEFAVEFDAEEEKRLDSLVDELDEDGRLSSWAAEVQKPLTARTPARVGRSYIRRPSLP
jgi:hypothetical protein